MKTLEATNSMAQVFLGFVMLGDNIGHIVKEAKGSKNTAVIGLAAVAIALELIDIKTLEATTSMAQVFLGLTMLGDNIGHIAKEVRCGGSTVLIGFAAVAIILEVLLLLFLGFILLIQVREKSPQRKRGRSSSDVQDIKRQLPPACNCRETVRETLHEFLPGAVKQAVEAALPAAGTPEPPDGNELKKNPTHPQRFSQNRLTHSGSLRTDSPTAALSEPTHPQRLSQNRLTHSGSLRTDSPTAALSEPTHPQRLSQNRLTHSGSLRTDSPTAALSEPTHPQRLSQNRLTHSGSLTEH
ncbi:hypothetical protein Q7C36_004127 [Tachysurus vachellii]|uniref:Uncharacterized protein n=1 Tax=Tachysurus vachellii TaxID=175792 RepID=A0AA88NJ72_TACVA|nr:hypothetical protein Q7C36_004127 [Tachysurus vachellii]